MLFREFYLDSSADNERIHVCSWMPDRGPLLILQLAHGMAEHIMRYAEFAVFLCEHRIGVIGNDHLGHGQSVHARVNLGYFAAKNGYEDVLSDLARITDFIHLNYEGIPVVLMGHSMGSFFVRRYLIRYPDKVNGAIIMGTGSYSRPEAAAGRVLAGFLRVLKGPFYRSQLVSYLAVDSFDKKFPKEGHNSWLSRDPETVKKYEEDELCGFRFTVSAYYDFFTLLLQLTNKKELDNMNKQLPVLFISGKEDPVGGFSKGVQKVYRDFRACGMKRVSLRLYSQDRHEVLNEINKKDVYGDILTWIREKMKYEK